MPSLSIKPFHTLDMNWDPRSLTISSGIPNVLKACWKNNSAVCSAVGTWGREMSLIALENLSIVMRIVLMLSDMGRSVIKSTAM